MSIQGKEAKSPNLHEPEDPILPAGKTMKHEGKMHRISSHKLG
jgi:hypothetical protein